MAFENFQHIDTSMFHQQTLLEWGQINPNCSALNNNHCLKLCSPEKSPESNNQLLTALQFQSKARTGERKQGLRQIFALNQEILSLDLEDLSNPKYQLWWPHVIMGAGGSLLVIADTGNINFHWEPYHLHPQIQVSRLAMVPRESLVHSQESGGSDCCGPSL